MMRLPLPCAALLASLWVIPVAAQVSNPPALPEASPEIAVSSNAWQFFTGTNAASKKTSVANPPDDFAIRLQNARHLRLGRLFAEAGVLYEDLLQSPAPEQIQRTALIDMAEMAQEQNDPSRAQQIYAQCLGRWPKDVGAPEILLRQGLVYRQMGMFRLAISKFYTVMTSALTLKPDSFDYYQQLVLRAQNEIAETQYEEGKYADAVDSFGRLLKLESPPSNRSTLAHRFIHCLVALGRQDEAIGQAQDFLERYPEVPERPEVHFLCATALKKAGRDAEALQQVLALLREQQGHGAGAARNLAYWQRRAGNEIANEFYQEGDPMKALDIYISLAALDAAPDWQLPVWYQIGLVFERLNQPAKAVEYYGNITRREKEVAADAPPSLKAVLEMAKWRADFLGWQLKAETTDLELRSATLGLAKANALPHQSLP